MALKKFVVGVFEEEGNLFNAIRRVRKSGYRLHDVYTPFLFTVSTEKWDFETPVFIPRDLFTV